MINILNRKQKVLVEANQSGKKVDLILITLLPYKVTLH